jgi:hypothetical protein
MTLVWLEREIENQSQHERRKKVSTPWATMRFLKKKWR